MDKWTQFTIWVDNGTRSAHWMKIFPLCLSFRISSLRSVSGWSDLTTCTWSLTGSNSPWSPESLQYSGGQGLEIPLTSHDFWVVHSGIGCFEAIRPVIFHFQVTPKWATLLLMKLACNRWHLAEWNETLKVVWYEKPEGFKKTANQSTVHRLTLIPHHHTVHLSKRSLSHAKNAPLDPSCRRVRCSRTGYMGGGA